MSRNGYRGKGWIHKHGVSWHRHAMSNKIRPVFVGLMLTIIGMSVIVPSGGYALDVKEPVRIASISDLTYFNATDLFTSIRADTSINNIGNYTKDLSEQFPNRTYDEEQGPSENLVGAWQWANATLKSITGGNMAFSQVTDYQHLISIKKGTAPAPRPVLVLTGTIDSELTPGANDAAVTVAVILEIARLLSSYELAYDVYFVLTNGGHLDKDIDYGGRAFVQWVLDNGIQSFTTISFDRLLFERSGYLYAYKINIRSFSSTDNYHDAQWIPDLMVQVSSIYGNGYFQWVPDYDVAERSSAYEMWLVGRPGLYVTQGYWKDPHSNSEDDVWDNPDFSLEKAKEAASVTASVVAYMGLLGQGAAPQRYLGGRLNSTEYDLMGVTASLTGYLNGTLTWDSGNMMQVSIMDAETREVVYQRTEDDGMMVLKYLVLDLGGYIFNVTNIGSSSTNFTLTVTTHEDMDGDGIKDFEEIEIGTSPYMRDSDLDMLSDDFELSIGSDPTSQDSDGDGASDYDEYLWGSSPLSNDTDADLISDAVEAELGTNPTSPDSDQDGLDDYLEVYVLHSNPLSSDTDLDGLEDGFEYEVGLNLLSPDTDGDSLSDLFEILNNISPFTADTDGDGWSDAYEIENCMLPNSIDTDGDGISDTYDWDPQEHWITVVSPVVLVSVIMLLISYSFLKMRVYKRM